MSKLYRIFSLCVESCIHLPEAPLIEEAANVDVKIEYGKIETIMRPAPNEPLNLFGFVRISDSCVQFGCRHAVYEISNANKIVIDPEKDATPEQLRLFLLGSTMAVLLTQRNFFPLHGGAVVVNGKAAIITGVAGAGKSTITSTIVKLGVPYLTDDVSALFYNQGVYNVLPSYPQRKLVRDACLQLGHNVKDLPIVDIARDKFAIRDLENWNCKHMPLAVMINLVPAGSDAQCIEVKKLNAKDNIRLVSDSLYRKELHMEKNGAYTKNTLQQILLIAAQVKAFEISVPRNIKKLEQFAGEIIELLKESCQ